MRMENWDRNKNERTSERRSALAQWNVATVTGCAFYLCLTHKGRWEIAAAAASMVYLEHFFFV